MTAVAASEPALNVPPTTSSRFYGEVFAGDGQIRPAWIHLVERLHLVSPDDLTRRAAQIEQMLDENGVTFNVFLEGGQSQRPWSLDLLPVILGTDEWARLSAGLTQRARLLNQLIRDCHNGRELIRDGTLPPEVLFANPGFLRPFVGLHTQPQSMMIYAAELARGPDGHFCVMADRADAPAGTAFALENRIVLSMIIPQALHDPRVQRLAPFFSTLQNTLTRLGQKLAENPRIVLLSPGSKYPYYFEDVYLARYLGYSLVEGADLAVRDDRVFLKTLAGLVPIDVIASRGGEWGIDPLELGGGEPHGVPGLLKVIRDGKVIVANVPGSGIIESPIFMAFLPKLCRRLLGEELCLPSIPTWWCGDPEQLETVRSRFCDLVIKPAFQASGGEEILAGKLDDDSRQRLWAQIQAQPYNYVAQELIARSAVPVFREGRIGTGHAAFRLFAVADNDSYTVMPGGLVRVAPTPDPMVLSVSAGDTSKDLWVLADEQVKPFTLLTDGSKPVALKRTSAVFPSRVADDLFWFGQSLDRGDFLSRLLRSVIERLMAESPADTPELPWLVRALADQGQIEPGFALDSFSAQLPTLAEELPQLVANVDEVRGLAAAISELDRLASLERLWMSPDTFRKVRETALDFRTSAETGWNGLVDVLEAVNQLILNLAAVSGLIHDGMVRGPAWRLLDLGRRIERARNTSTLLQSVMALDAKIERPVLKALLEVIDCRMTYRARYFDNVLQNAVLDLCLTDETCPRSLATQLTALAEHIDALPSHRETVLRNEETRAVAATVHVIRMISPAQLEEPPTEHLQGRLVELDHHLRVLSKIITRKYLLHSGIPRQITSGMELPQ